MSTFRRDRLRRLAEAGRLAVVESYHFDDMTGESRDKAVGLPVAIMPSDWHDRRDGVCYLFPGDFTSKSGTAWRNHNGTVTLIVHDNADYIFRILPESAANPV